MSYKTILVHADPSRHAQARIQAAAALAIAHDAHLVGSAAVGISRLIYEAGAFPSGDASLVTHIDALRERARGALAEFDAAARAAGVASIEARLLDDEPSGGMALQARYADLVVITQTDRDEATNVLPDFPQYVILNGARPVLVLPHTRRIGQIGANILVAWDGGPEATRAITGALPLLQKAREVEILVINPEARYGTHGEQPGADMALYLARHGVKVRVTQRNGNGDAGEALLSHAADSGADLLVMGCYGHARFRETFVGGVTDTVLRSMILPVLMAH